MTAKWVSDYVHGRPGSKETLLAILESAQSNFDALARECKDEDLCPPLDMLIEAYAEVIHQIRATTRAPR